MRARTFIAIGVFLSLFTISLLYFYLKTVDKEREIVPQIIKSEIRRDVVVSKQTIPVHSLIDSTMVYTKDMKETEVPKEALQGLGSVVGGIAQTTIKKGSPILSHQVSFDIKLAYKVPEGKRAVTLVVDKGQALSYLVKPGDLVDVVGKFDEDFAGEELGKTIIQSAGVLAIDQQHMPRVSEKEDKKGENVEEEEISFETVTLAIPLEDVEKLVLGIDKSAQIKLALRNPKETGKVITQGANRYRLLERAVYRPKPKPKVEPKPKPPEVIPKLEVKEEVKEELKRIEIYRGVSKETIEIN